jgi:hypothetical protein
LHGAAGKGAEGEGRLGVLGTRAAPLVALLAVWVWMAFSSGGYVARLWLPGSLVLGLLGLVVSCLVIYPRRPRQLSLAVLACFAVYAIWIASSTIWSLSSAGAWLEAERTFTYLLFFSLALVFLAHRGVRVAFRYLLLSACLVIVLLAIIRIWSAADLAPLFFDNRFTYPIGYHNGAAALYLIAFWPLLWLATDHRERAPVRGLALGVCTALLGLAFMTQSRGAFWSLGITLLITFVISPTRLKTLLYLIVPALLMVWAIPNLNQYWAMGAAGLSGDVAGRTTLVIMVTAAFIGMIMALLEHWVGVSKRMRLIFGVVVLLAAAAAITYGTVTLTKDAGGPIQWVSKTWQQFTNDQMTSGDQGPGSSESPSTRLFLLSNSGRIDLWRVAWLDFKNSPAIGVGASGFVFTYDRLRHIQGGVLHPHSWELQILSETGVVGGVFCFGGVLLVLGGLLWPRCAAGWQGARGSWLRSRRRESAETELPPSAGSQSRWGSDPRAYGWEMALLAGVLYLLIHGSVEWIWQIVGVAIPALLLAAAGLSEVDARAGSMWPRLANWSRLGRPARPVQHAPAAPESSPSAADDSPIDERTILFTENRRAAHYESQRLRRERRERRHRRLAKALVPPGPLSHSFRILLGALSLLILVGGGLPYLSLNLQDTALGSTASDPEGALARADLAARLNPMDAGPFQVRAYVYQRAAQAAAASTNVDRAGAVLDGLALALASQEQGIHHEPADWAWRYNAGVAALNLLLATDAISGRAIVRPESQIVGLDDWSNLAPDAGSSPSTPVAPGIATGSLANTTETMDTANRYRQLSRKELLALADRYLHEAHDRYPLLQQVDEALSFLGLLAIR